MLPARSGVLSLLHKHVMLHRRLVAAGLAFVAVFCGLSAVTSALGRDVLGGSSPGASLGKGEVLVPVRLEDPDVAVLASAGSVVDVIDSAATGTADVVASGVTVVDTLDASSGLWDSSGGLIVVGASSQQALELAAAQKDGGLSIVVHP